MDKVTECLNALIEEMRESRAYQNYLCMEQELEKDPELKSRVDDYRIRNYRLQQSENVDLYDAVDSLERDSYVLRKSEKANAYPMRRKTPCFSYGDIRRVHRIYASN